MKVVKEDVLIKDFVKMLDEKEYWVKVPWTIPRLCSYGAILLFGKDAKGFYYRKDGEKCYVDITKIPSVKLVEVKNEFNRDS